MHKCVPVKKILIVYSAPHHALLNAVDRIDFRIVEVYDIDRNDAAYHGRRYSHKMKSKAVVEAAGSSLLIRTGSCLAYYILGADSEPSR